MKLEKRKFNYLLKEANITEEELEKRFNKIDEMMSKIKIGSIIYEHDAFDGAYPQKIIDIIDKENGIVEIYEESINKKSKICILSRYLTLKEALKDILI